MTRPRRLGQGAALAAALCLSCWPAAGQVDTAKDLATVIMLRGKPCGAVTSFKKNAENDYNVVCRTGDRYRVSVNAQGKVTVRKL